MTVFLAWLRATDAAKWAGTIIIAWAGLAYIILPPVSTVGLYSAAWPARAWGAMMLTGGIVTIYGLWSRLIDWEKFGMTVVLVGIASLTANQTLLMLDYPPTYTRLGGTLVYLAGTAWVMDRTLRLSSDKRLSDEAEARYEGR